MVSFFMGEDIESCQPIIDAISAIDGETPGPDDDKEMREQLATPWLQAHALPEAARETVVKQLAVMAIREIL